MQIIVQRFVDAWIFLNKSSYDTHQGVTHYSAECVMQNETITKIIDYSFKLVSEASLSFYGAKGTGLGAVLGQQLNF